MSKARVTKAVFPAAGLGTRFLPATKASPKEMLPIVDKPQIEYAVDEARACGIRDFVIITGKNKRAIEDHFDVAPELEESLRAKGRTELVDRINRFSDYHFGFVRQGVPLGLGHAVLCAEPFVNNEAFAVLLSDDVIDPDQPLLRRMTEHFEYRQAPVVALMEVPEKDVSKYGIVKARPVGDELFEIEDLVEKPAPADAPSRLAIIGRYVLTSDIFRHLKDLPPGAGGEIQLTDGIRSQLSEGPIYGLRFSGNRYDAGDKLGFLKATTELALKDPALKDAFHAYLSEKFQAVV